MTPGNRHACLLHFGHDLLDINLLLILFKLRSSSLGHVSCLTDILVCMSDIVQVPCQHCVMIYLLVLLILIIEFACEYASNFRVPLALQHFLAASHRFQALAVSCQGLLQSQLSRALTDTDS